jgi:hypothetical protein
MSIFGQELLTIISLKDLLQTTSMGEKVILVSEKAAEASEVVPLAEKVN